jgi:hypothetical protein
MRARRTFEALGAPIVELPGLLRAGPRVDGVLPETRKPRSALADILIIGCGIFVGTTLARWLAQAQAGNGRNHNTRRR